MMPECVERAAHWQARLASDLCTERDRAAFSLWLGRDPRNRQAYDLVSQIWMQGSTVGGKATTGRRRTARRHVLTAMAGLGAVFLTTARHADAHIVATRRREQRRIRVGRSDILMDACSLLRYGPIGDPVTLDQGRYAVTLSPGQESMPLHCATWRLGGQSAAFDIVRTREQLTCAVVGGAALLRSPEGGMLRLGRGDVLHVTAKEHRVTHSSLDVLLAWRDGQAVFRNTSLADAVSEMARYSDRPVILHDPQLSVLQISGIFHTAHPERFFSALPHLLHVRVAITARAIEIVKL